jgi:purine-binding chemotaxis protein CheW
VLDIVGCNVSQVRPVPRISQGSRADFLSGLVTIESGMVALIDLSHLLTESTGDAADNAAASV